MELLREHKAAHALSFVYLNTSAAQLQAKEKDIPH